MNMRLKACVPVKPYLLKFVRHIENLEEGDILNINNGGVVGFVLKGYLTTKINLQRRDTEKTYATFKKEYTDSLWYEVDEDMKQFNKFHISRKSIVAFNSFLHRLFHDFLLFELLKSGEEAKEIRGCILEFMEHFDLEEGNDYDYDAIKQANFRLRKGKKIQLFQ